MSENLSNENEWSLTDADDYEEISSDEVDRIVAELENLAGSVESENIRYHLSVAALEIHRLVYEDGENDIAEAA